MSTDITADAAAPGLPAGTADVVAEAAATADRAMRAVGVTVVELESIAEMGRACELLDRVWQPEPGNPLISAKLLKVLSHCGSYVVAALRGDRMVGVCVGLLADVGLHSHIAGVEDAFRGAGLGHALKLHQRAWSLARGIGTVTWTFDPLISRNAYFNLAKLGAVPEEYLPDFYGPMPDAVNAGTESDRLLVRWDLASERVVDAVTGRRTVMPDRGGAAVALAVAADGRPLFGPRESGPGRRLVGVPRNVEELRQADPELAELWRRALREVLGESMERGGVVTGFTRDGTYVVEQGPDLERESKV